MGSDITELESFFKKNIPNQTTILSIQHGLGESPLGGIQVGNFNPKIKNAKRILLVSTHTDNSIDEPPIEIQPDIKLGHLCDAYLEQNPYALIQNPDLEAQYNQFLNTSRKKRKIRT